MNFTFGYNWLDLVYLIVVIVGPGLYIFKPWKEKTKEEKKDSKKIVGYWSKHGRRGYVTKSQEDFEAKYWLYGFLLTFLLIILPWLLQELGWL